MTSAPGDDDSITVLQGIGPQDPGKVTNPYTVLFLDSLKSRTNVKLFAWRTAIVGRYDVLHLHWPELLIRGAGLRRIIKPILLGALLLRLRISRTPIVRTAHNIDPHESGTRLERLLLRQLEAMTTSWIIMNRSTPLPSHANSMYIPHGHYRDWYAPVAAERKPRSLLYFGSLRGYKGVDDLLRAVSESSADVQLRIVGSARDAETRDLIESFTSHDSRITADLRFVSDDELAVEIAQTERVILPYRNLHNSGAALLALSMNRPVVVPSTPSTLELVGEFGENWVTVYEAPLTAAVIEEVAAKPWPDAEVDMSQREWSTLAEQTYAVYVDAMKAKR